MLYKLHTNILIIGLLTIGFMAVKVYDRAFSLMTLCLVISFISQMALMILFSRKEQERFSDKTIFSTVFVYSILICSLFMLISFYYEGDTWMFSKSDALYYYNESSKAARLGIFRGFKYILDTSGSDDWGALMFFTVLMYIAPYKLLLNTMYFLFGAITSVMLFRTGKAFMSESYAFMAALAYCTSSYVMFFHCTFLKESLFVMIVVSVLYFHTRAVSLQSRKFLVYASIGIVLIFFFRPPVAAILAASVFVYYGITMRKTALSLFLYLAAIGLLAVSVSVISTNFERYTAGGSVDAMVNETNNGAYSGGFNYFVSIFGALFGPFPSVFSSSNGPSVLEFFGAGLTYKLFLIIPFWYGVYSVFKNKVIEMIPIMMFVLVEMLSTGMTMASLELRKVLLHVPFMFTLIFYGLYKGFIPYKLTRLSTFACYIFAIGVMVLWNVIKVKNA